MNKNILAFMSAALFCMCKADGAKSSEPEPSGPSYAFDKTEQLDDTTWYKHDKIHQVSCWVYFYEKKNDVSLYEPKLAAGGISCVPDYQLKE